MTETGYIAVAETLARIMAARHPGTSWVPVRPGTPAARPGQLVRRLADPEDLRAIREGAVRGRQHES
jgi:hypothetical protein